MSLVKFIAYNLPYGQQIYLWNNAEVNDFTAYE